MAGGTSSAVWFDGKSGLYPGGAGSIGASSNSDNSIVQIGGNIPAMEYLVSGTSKVVQVPFSGGLDESRITAASRYDRFVLFNSKAILRASARVIPWPNS